MATESETGKEGGGWKWWAISALGGVGIIAVWLIVGHSPMWFAPIKNPALPGFGTYGDMFGFVNSLFSALALFAVIVTLWLQRKELQLQREELKKTTAAQARAATAQEEVTEVQKQAILVQEQQAETTSIATYMQGLIALQQSEEIPGDPEKGYRHRIADMLNRIENGEMSVAACIRRREEVESLILHLLRIRESLLSAAAGRSDRVREVVKGAHTDLQKLKGHIPGGKIGLFYKILQDTQLLGSSSSAASDLKLVRNTVIAIASLCEALKKHSSETREED